MTHTITCILLKDISISSSALLINFLGQDGGANSHKQALPLLKNANLLKENHRFDRLKAQNLRLRRAAQFRDFTNQRSLVHNHFQSRRIQTRDILDVYSQVIGRLGCVPPLIVLRTSSK